MLKKRFAVKMKSDVLCDPCQKKNWVSDCLRGLDILAPACFFRPVFNLLNPSAMQKKFYALLALLFLTSAAAFAQTNAGTLKGKVFDKDTKEPFHS
jgi:hypothetical protein